MSLKTRVGLKQIRKKQLLSIAQSDSINVLADECHSTTNISNPADLGSYFSGIQGHPNFQRF